MAREKIATKVIAEDMSGVDINFTDGGKVSVVLGDLSPEIVTHTRAKRTSPWLWARHRRCPSV